MRERRRRGSTRIWGAVGRWSARIEGDAGTLMHFGAAEPRWGRMGVAGADTRIREGKRRTIFYLKFILFSSRDREKVVNVS
jgi:hypothetical protein